MERQRNFEPSVENQPRKITKTRLNRLLEGSGLQYSIKEDGSNVTITIDLPDEHIREKEQLETGHVLNEGIKTKFDEEKFLPVYRAIAGSTNLDCRKVTTDDKSKYVLSVFKK